MISGSATPFLSIFSSEPLSLIIVVKEFWDANLGTQAYNQERGSGLRKNVLDRKGMGMVPHEY